MPARYGVDAVIVDGHLHTVQHASWTLEELIFLGEVCRFHFLYLVFGDSKSFKASSLRVIWLRSLYVL